ncbi:MAG: 2-amino-4-hydroxy-6-hydroxymethyldihydropteridine diphosphokinase [Candidatus Eremiobacteraeota bacterium]|nr:2-amino-4-hydroxy-6-hydroxymethyldihydropteridine diphosphokinase [Candidatus Eremiobacteraeota bacterium]
MALARIGVGSNAEDAAPRVERALEALSALGTVVSRSRLYGSKPWGEGDQPDFVNAAALLETSLSPRALLDALKMLETAHGRVPTYRWGPRAIDLDILAYDDLELREEGLHLPHERLAERAFALVPLAEIDPTYEAALGQLTPAARSEVLPLDQRIGAETARRRVVVDWEQSLKRVREAAEFCASAGLERFRIDEDGLEIEVRRSAPASRRPHALDNADVIPAAAPIAANGAVENEPHPTVLKADVVGILRLSRPAVTEGAELDGERELAYVEALGVRNPIRWSGRGRVASVFVGDGQPVEFGQPLFAIDPRA